VAYDRETGKHYIYREYYGKDKAPEENAKNIMSKTFTREHVITTYSDTYKESVLSYRNSGMSIIPAQKGAGSIEAGINQLRSLLYAGRIEIDKKCKGLITELESYAYNPNTGKPYDRDNNFIDALRYVLWAIEGKSHAITISKTTYKPTEDVSVDANLMYLGLGPDGKPLYARLT
jgi:phage terminase large subunit